MAQYIISTFKAAIPHIIDSKHDFLDHPLCVYLDDIYYKGSFFYDDGSVNLKTFINTQKPLVVKFRNGPKLETPRGRYKLKEDEYNRIVKKLNASFHQEYNSKAYYHGFEIFEPTNIQEAVELLKAGNVVTTIFIDTLVDKGMLLTMDGDVRSVKDDFVCTDCCRSRHPEYLRHLWDTKEINAKTFIALHNYKKWHDIAAKIQ